MNSSVKMTVPSGDAETTLGPYNGALAEQERAIRFGHARFGDYSLKPSLKLCPARRGKLGVFKVQTVEHRQRLVGHCLQYGLWHIPRCGIRRQQYPPPHNDKGQDQRADNRRRDKPGDPLDTIYKPGAMGARKERFRTVDGRVVWVVSRRPSGKTTVR